MPNKLLQKDIFLQSEADEWFERNKQATAKQLFTKDAVCNEVKKIIQAKSSLNKTLKNLIFGETNDTNKSKSKCKSKFIVKFNITKNNTDSIENCLNNCKNILWQLKNELT
jgi:hypothetical protein